MRDHREARIVQKIEQGGHLQLPQPRAVCILCCTGALGAESHSLLEFIAFADVRADLSSPVAKCSGAMAKLARVRKSPWSAATALYGFMRSHANDIQPILHFVSFIAAKDDVEFLPSLLC